MIGRRSALSGAAWLGAGLGLLRGKKAAADEAASASAATANPAPAGKMYTPVVTPNGSTLPWTWNDGVKEFHLVAEPVKREFAPGMTVDCWGYNGQTPGPTIEAVEGDRVRLFVTNRLPERTSMHWHGALVPNGMDGVAGLTQPAILPGETYVYELTLRQHGTLMYHPHSDEMVQMALGMMGFFVIHPRPGSGESAHVDRDFAIFLAEWAIAPGTSRPNPMVMLDFNTFTFNSRAWPGTDALRVRTGDRVRVRLANLSMDSHPIHLHGHRFSVTGTDAGIVPPSARFLHNTLDVPVGTTRDIEFVADNPGDWPLHCHKSHHAMNAMSHDIPNMIGVDPGDAEAKIRKVLPGYMAMGQSGMGNMMDMGRPANTLPMMAGKGPYGSIEMGGMFTLLKVRDRGHEADEWYTPPAGTIARKVSR
jgi:FtsP/CotA-like multicopper oxidase with cupredoxin domain